MAKQTINIGTTANDGTGDAIRAAFGKVNDNFTEIYTANTGVNTGDQNLSAYATTAAVAAGYQPLDSDLTAISALTTTAYGRALLSTADAATLRSAIGVGTTDAPTFLAQTLTATTGTMLAFSGANQVLLSSAAAFPKAIVPNWSFLTATTGGINMLYTSPTATAIPEASTYQWGTDLILARDAPGILAQRNGTNAQAFRVYNTYGGVGGVDYERGFIRYATGFLEIGYEFGGLGGTRDVQVTGPKHIWLNAGAAGVVGFKTAGVFRAYFDNFGHFRFNADNTYDIGLSNTDRPRNVFVGTAITAGGGISGQNFGSSAGGYFNWATRSNIFSPADGVIRLANDAQTDFGRLQLGGTTSAFPAIKRNGTGIDIRLADDSAFAPVKGKITTDTNYTAGVPSATGYLTIYDATGTAYRVPCTV